MAAHMKKSMMNDLFINLLRHYSTLSEDPACFVSVQDQSGDVLKQLTKAIYDWTKGTERTEHEKRKDAAKADDSDADGAKSDRGRKYYHPKALPELIIEGFDQEQIWQELELQNKYVLKNLKKRVSELNENAQTLSGQVFTDREVDEQYGGAEQDSQSEEDEAMLRIIERGDGSGDSDFDFGEDETSEADQEDADEEDPEDRTTSDTVAIRPSAVDDQFFKLSQLENFLVLEDKKEELIRDEGLNPNKEEPEDDLIDYFEDMPSSEDDMEDEDDDDDVESKRKGARFWTYEDFFDPPVEEGHWKTEDTGQRREEGDIKRSKILDPGDDDSGKEDEAKDDAPPQAVGKSNHEKRQEKLRQITQEHEETNLSLKPWQMLGEVRAEQRPENSLLQEDLDYNHLGRPPPTITEEVTVKIEDIIKQRIKDKAYDDVERKIKPVEEPYEYKKKIVLDQEKSKLSLAEIYEQEYIKQQQTEKVEEESLEHAEIRETMTTLFTKLDVLFSFHFTPRAPAPEIRIVNRIPAISVEEVAPLAMSEGNLVAPEEVKEKSKGEMKGSTEKTKSDRRRDRKISKRAKRRKAVQRAERDKILEQTDRRRKRNKRQGKGDKNDKTQASQDKGKKQKIGSSAFFSKLQDEVKKAAETSSKDGNKKVKRKPSRDPKEFDAKKFKL